MIGNVGEVSVSFAVFQVHYLQDALRFLQEDVGLFVLVLLDELVGDVGQLE